MKSISIQRIIALVLILISGSCSLSSKHLPDNTTNSSKPMTISKENTDTVILAGGCFWCTEAIFQRLKGVDTVISGYSGGQIKNPTYREVCSGLTGHAEALEVVYDKSVISLTDLLEVFFKTHDPTTLNRQGADAGTQYRSAVFYKTPEQKEVAERVIKTLNEGHAFDDPIVTEVTAFTNFYPAEDYHQNYYNDNKEQGYCRVVIHPKLDKLEKLFRDKLK